MHQLFLNVFNEAILKRGLLMDYRVKKEARNVIFVVLNSEKKISYNLTLLNNAIKIALFKKIFFS